jgi:hypothetical protein
MAFEKCTLPRARWTHAAHLTVAHHYLWHYPRREATQRLRIGIQRYNIASGNPSGYHETITLAWVALILRELRKRRRRGTTEEEAESASEIAMTCADQRLLLQFYSKERLMSAEARARWLSPDLKIIE